MELPAGLLFLLDRVDRLLLNPASIASLTSLTCALVVAFTFLAIRRFRRQRRIRLRMIARALFPKRITGSRSHAVDVGYFFFNVTVFALILGWAVLSYQVLTNLVIDGLVAAFGARSPVPIGEVASRTIMTMALFLAYELGYWLNHYLMHKVPFLWEFHKVHHSAEVLTPLTNFRVHPVDGLVHANAVVITTAVTNGSLNYLLGETAYQYAINDRNIMIVVFIHVLLHLQHTHLWIAFRGLAGRLVLSPAHHQIHHSNNPIHFDKNLGGSLAIWDWVFGTLHIPQKEPEKLTFGVDEPDGVQHAHDHLSSSLWRPIRRASALAARAMGLRGPRRQTRAAPAIARGSSV